MKLVAGLGNPGPRYAKTRHNIGFRVIDQLANVNSASGWQLKFESLTADCQIGAEKIMLVKPMTFMNLSGRAVRKAVDFYKLQAADVLVVCDDMDLPLGRLRMRPGGSSGGQKGLKDIIAHLGTEEVPRLRVGIGRQGFDAVDHVLSEFSPGERETIDHAVIDAARACECWCVQGVQAAMNQFNGIGKSGE